MHNDDYYKGLRDGLLMDAGVQVGRAVVAHSRTRAQSKDYAVDLMRQARGFQKSAMQRSTAQDQLADFKHALKRASKANAVRSDVVSDRCVIELQRLVDRLKRHVRNVGPYGPAVRQTQYRGDNGLRTIDIS